MVQDDDTWNNEEMLFNALFCDLSVHSDGVERGGFLGEEDDSQLSQHLLLGMAMASAASHYTSF